MVHQNPDYKPQVTEAVYKDGVLRPIGRLSLGENERVRVIVQTLQQAGDADRAAAVERLRAGVASMNFVSDGRYPQRDELHERR